MAEASSPTCSEHVTTSPSMMLSSSPSGPDSLACTCSVGSDSASVAADSASSALAPACVRASARPASERSHSSADARTRARVHACVREGRQAGTALLTCGGNSPIKV
eukprot:290756-Chlamydomonas_euryale.AAC.1